MSILEKKYRLEIGKWLIEDNASIAKNLAYSGSFIPRIKQDIDNNRNTFDEYIVREVACLIDYVRFFFTQEKAHFRALYIGERLKMCYDSECSAQDRNDRLIEFMKRDKKAFLQILPKERSKINDVVSSFFDDIILEFQVPVEKELRVLFIGDCIHQDVMGSLSVLIMQYGAALSPHMIASKNVFQLRAELKNIEGYKFDAVFYSPLSYEYNLNFSKLIHYRNVFMSGFKLAESVTEVFEEIETITDAILTSFDCPVFIHNTACIIRDESRIKLLVKSILTMRLRKQAVEYIHKRLKKYIEDRNSVRFKQLFLVDERSLLSQNNSYELGKYIYKSALQHPTKLGMLIAKEYNNILFVLANLYGKKLIVCDLDNTLWDGVIGEGKVNHFVERQKVLLNLKSKGVLLAINSKNDPKNIHWDGGVLSDDDFVYKAISWQPKINAFPKMESKLNLKMKDFVFIDDRADELDLVGTVHSSIKCLDALNLDTWYQLGLWEGLLDDANTMDRTQMYKEREHRGDFLNQIEESVIDEAEIFKNLDLVLSLKEVQKNELKRVVELINRTNQFNMRGSRTSFNEAQSWLNSEDFSVLQASMKDKFGDMGVVSVIVLEKNESNIKIPIFVLSCRVFGYKVEVAILNEVKRIAQQKGIETIVGEYIETASNLPCSKVYSESSFTMEGGEGVFNVPKKVVFDDPEWLQVITTIHISQQ